jgi:hypothetical protein
LKQEEACLRKEETLRLISRNIDPVSLNRAERATAAIDHLRGGFGERSPSSPPSISSTSSQPQPQPRPLIIMLQGVRGDSLHAILAHGWVQDNFIISGIVTPDPARQWHFNLLLVSRGLKTLTSGDDGEGWFRMRLGNNPDHYALFVDIPIASSAGKQGSASTGRKTEERIEVLRLCTVNLGPPPYEGQDRRPLMLAAVAAQLRDPLPAGTGGVKIVGVVVDGDMNSLCARDVARHRAGDVSLRDAWEEPASPNAPNCRDDSTRRFSGSGETEKDKTYGRERGHTYGSRENWTKGPGKFFCHGESLEMHAIHGAQDYSGKAGRVGNGVDHFNICVGVRIR